MSVGPGFNDESLITSNMPVLSWLCKKGEDVLSKHAQHSATTLTAARHHEREFEKFYFTSMVSTISVKYLSKLPPIVLEAVR
uniref:Uncharacterized protein n=1 Tax=Vespula pensylvanica TaxID=30213 RepID=A0A834JVJ1_VESPE|nr:hypothetical protein H0235_016986 [Vespula pensylvanica]